MRVAYEVLVANLGVALGRWSSASSRALASTAHHSIAASASDDFPSCSHRRFSASLSPFAQAGFHSREVLRQKYTFSSELTTARPSRTTWTKSASSNTLVRYPIRAGPVVFIAKRTFPWYRSTFATASLVRRRSSSVASRPSRKSAPNCSPSRCCQARLASDGPTREALEPRAALIRAQWRSPEDGAQIREPREQRHRRQLWEAVEVLREPGEIAAGGDGVIDHAGAAAATSMNTIGFSISRISPATTVAVPARCHLAPATQEP